MPEMFHARVDQRELLIAVNAAKLFVNRSRHLPILQNLHFAADADCITVSATDLDSEIAYYVAGEGAGSTTIPTQMLTSILKNGSKGAITLTTDENHVTTVRGEGSAMQIILGMSPEDFPRLSPSYAYAECTVNEPILSRLLTRTLPFMGDRVLRPILCGVRVLLARGVLRFITTDTYRLAVAETSVSMLGTVTRKRNFPGATAGATIPAGVMTKLAKLLNKRDADATLTMEFSGEHVLIENDRFCIIARLIDGLFPSYERVTPDGFQSETTLNRKQFLAAVKRVGAVTRNAEGLNRVILHLGDALTITATANAIERAEERLEGGHNGPYISIAFNSNYLADACKCFDSDMLTMQANAALSPVVFRPLAEERSVSGYLIVVPMTLGTEIAVP